MALADKKVCIWSVATGQPLKTLQGHKGKVLSVAFSPEGETLAVSGRRNGVVGYVVAEGKAATGMSIHSGPLERPVPGTIVRDLASSKHQMFFWERTAGPERHLRS